MEPTYNGWVGELATPPSPWQRQSSSGSDWSVTLVPLENTAAAFEEIFHSATDIELSDDTEDDEEEEYEQENIEHTGTNKERKNQKERERMALKRLLLEELASIIQRSDLIPDSEKKLRFTEAWTVYLTRKLIRCYEEQVAMKGGRMNDKEVLQPAPTPKPASSTLTKVPKKKTNSFINFSGHFRDCFVQALREVSMKWSGLLLKKYPHNPMKNPSQKLVQKVAAEVWKKVDKERWPSHCTILNLARTAVEKIF